MSGRFLLISLILVSFIFVRPLFAEEVVLSTGEWPPFSSASLFGGGSTTLMLKKAFESQEVKLSAKFMAWSEVTSQAENTKEIHGWYPAYFSEARSKACAWSNIIGTSLVGFAHLSGSRFSWKTLDDLKRYRVGVVAGYVNEREFDAQVASGGLQVLTSDTDVDNLMALVNKQVDAAVIDRRVMVHLLRKNPKLKPQKSLIKFDLAALKEHPLYVCFTGSERQKWAGILNAGLQATSISKFEGGDPFMKRLKKK
jgi:polar amino acid transport system substrate-binding protein